MKTGNLEWYLGLNYEVHLIKRDEMFYLLIPDLQIIIQDTDLNMAQSKLQDAKRELIQKYLEIGKEKSIPLPSETLKKRHFISTMTPFLLKIAILAFVALLLIVTANISFTYILEETPKLVAKKALRALVTYELTPEAMEKYRKDVRIIVHKLKPFTNELAPLFLSETRTTATNDNVSHSSQYLSK